MEFRNQKSDVRSQILFCFLSSVFCLLSSVCYAQSISSTELIQNAQEYDGKEIVYEGEVVGQIMQRRDGTWVNIHDGENALGVWMSPESAAIIKHKGRYKAKGDILRIVGVFNYACLEHGGDLDIHARSVSKIKSGRIKQERMILAKRNLLIILMVITCLILILKISIIR